MAQVEFWSLPIMMCGADVRMFAGTLVRTLLIASLGGLAVHYLETVRPAAAARKGAAGTAASVVASKKKGDRQEGEQEVFEKGGEIKGKWLRLLGLGRRDRVKVEPAALAI